MEAVNLHLTGDFHAVTSAHNLLTAMVDNHLHHGNELGIDPRTIAWRRVLDVNDRSLRNVVVGLGARMDGVPRQAGFDITAASEVMVILSLASSLRDMRERLGRIVVGFTYAGDPVTAEDLKAAGAMTVMLRDAIKPNLLQTLENTPALIHAGPFGNIATGNSSVVADLLGIQHGDFLLTEAGFGADMGAERFFDVKCRASGLRPDAAVLVVTVRALKAHSGRYTSSPAAPASGDARGEPRRRTPGWAEPGSPHRDRAPFRRVARGRHQRLPRRPRIRARGHQGAGGRRRRPGRRRPARHRRREGRWTWRRSSSTRPQEPTSFRFLYELDRPWSRRSSWWRGRSTAPTASTSARPRRPAARFERLGYGEFPVVIAKTHLSLSSDPTLLGAPTGWRMPVREVRAAAGAGYVYAISGEMRTMPGLPRHPAAERIDIDDDGNRRPVLGIAAGKGQEARRVRRGRSAQRSGVTPTTASTGSGP